MQYEHIPEPERTSFVSLATYQACALRELSEELLRKTQDGHFSRFRPDTERIKALGFFELSNDHNREYSWAFVYFLPDMGPYASQDTFLHDGAEEIIDLPVQAFTWKELLQIFHGNSGEKRLSDGIGRILLHEEGDKLHKIIPVRTEYEMDCDQKCEMAYQKMKTLMTQPEPPTAIFTSNNMMTLGCLRYLTEHNLQIGKDIALIGFDDIEILQMIDYKLSVVTRSEESMGVLAMEMILRRQDKDFRKHECERIPAKLVLRGSEKCRTTGLIQRQPCL